MKTYSTTSDHDHAYAQLEALVRERAATITGPLFTTDADPDALWRAYLDGIPAEHRQHYNCHTCRRFIQRYGGLVAISETGGTWNSVWNASGNPWEMPKFFYDSASVLNGLSVQARVTGVFLSSEKVWGTPFNIPSPPSKFQGQRWTHLATINSQPFKHTTLSAEQRMAELRGDFGILCHSLADYPVAVVEQALRILGGGVMYRSEKGEGVVRWFHDLHQRLKEANGPRRANLIWLAVAAAPPGFVHVRSSVVGTLIQDVKDGLPFDSISRRWAEKLHPLQYQRPTSLKEGSIKQAEDLVEKLGCARSLERRFARLEDVQQWLWKPVSDDHLEEKPGSVFDHLKQKTRGITEVELPPKKITWEKFRRDVLPTALGIDVQVPWSGPFFGLVTAVHADAPPILQWDGLVESDSDLHDMMTPMPRNPVSWYFYSQGSPATQWHLTGGSWVKCTRVFEAPYHWYQNGGGKFRHQGEKAMFSLVGAWDANGDKAGLGLFPEILKADFHGIRQVIEAHSRKGGIQGREEGNANGISVQKGQASNLDLALRVRTAGGVSNFVIDRWE